MKKTRFTETQIISILKQQEAGRSVKDLAKMLLPAEKKRNHVQSQTIVQDIHAA
jgi:hypothetical protein